MLRQISVTTSSKPNNIGNLSEKLEYYKLNKDSFNLLFVGDSRTYTNIHNYALDSLIGSKSYNHAVWANWFPTQYAFLVDFLPQIPDSTCLVFSYGHQNFMDGEIQETYPINKALLSDYYNWGFTYADLLNPISLSDNSLNKYVFIEKKRNRKSISAFLNRQLAVLFSSHKGNKSIQTINNVESSRVETSRALQMRNYYNKLEQVVATEVKYSNDTATSVEVYWKKGNYWRVEITPDFFRRKQIENQRLLSKSYTPQKIFEPDKRYWNNFLAIAKLLGKHSKRLKIFVNEMEEAPYTYKLSGHFIYNEFIGKTVNPILKENNLNIIKVDVNEFPDNYYFDYNHLNTEGSKIYTQKLAEILSPYITK